MEGNTRDTSVDSVSVFMSAVSAVRYRKGFYFQDFSCSIVLIVLIMFVIITGK